MVFKGDEAESSLLPSGALFYDVNAFNLSIFFKMLPDVVLLGILFDPTDKDLLDGQMGAGFIGVLKQRALMSTQQTPTWL